MDNERDVNTGIAPDEIDLAVDHVYEGGQTPKAGAGNDPISKLLGCGNQGGFRYRGSVNEFKIQFIVLISSLAEIDWPDSIDLESGILTYYGDNRNPGSQILETKRKGNTILEWVFNSLHANTRELIPPIFVFTKVGRGRDYCFRGMAVPGAEGVPQTEDLVAVWKTKNDMRFQNYRAIFTILDISRVPRKWIDDMKIGAPTRSAPLPWINWIRTGRYQALKSVWTTQIRSRGQQLPSDANGKAMIELIYKTFKEQPHRFEHCSSAIFRLSDRNVLRIDVTRPTKDGGRDAVGEYVIGQASNRIKIRFALEAKLYNSNKSVGVKEVARLVSRLRQREFGVLVTTSFVATQAYQEILEDRHPIIIISAKDIVDILVRNGYQSEDQLRQWLSMF